MFDGLAVDRFFPDGRFLRRAYHDAVQRADLNDGSAAIALVGTGLLSLWGGYYFSAFREPPDRYRWSIVRHASGRPDTVLSVR